MPIKPVGAGKLRKKSLSTKVKETFLSTDLPDVKSDIVKSIIVPQAKNMVLDAIRSVATGVVGTAEMMLFGRVTRGLSDYRRGGSIASRVRYDTISSSSARTLTPQQRASFSIESIEFEGIEVVDGIERNPKQQAQAVIDSMIEHIEMYEYATVRDLYDFAGVTTRDFTESYYGWHSFATARPEPIAGGKYIIVCPKPEYLGERK
jgi:hypothetical protein